MTDRTSSLELAIRGKSLPVLAVETQRYQQAQDRFFSQADSTVPSLITSREPVNISGRKVSSLVQDLPRISGIALKSSQISDLSSGTSENVFLPEITLEDEQLIHLAKLADRLQVTLTCDHFAQVERYAQIAATFGVRFNILISVCLDNRFQGARPGPDLSELSKGISYFPQLELIGLTGFLGEACDSSSEDFHRAPRRIEILKEMKRFVQQNCATFVEVTGASESIKKVQTADAVILSSFLNVCHKSLPESVVTLFCRVLSRPRLDRAVLNVGSLHLGGDSSRLHFDRIFNGISLSNVSISQMHFTSCDITLNEHSRDLAIGDIVQISIQDGRQLVERASRERLPIAIVP